MFPGDHFFLHTAQEPLLQALGHELAAYLAG
jgi:surfactin synthase thioesterase subunit